MPTLEPRRGKEQRHFLRQRRTMRRETEESESEKKNESQKRKMMKVERPTKDAEQEMSNIIHDLEANLSAEVEGGGVKEKLVSLEMITEYDERR